MLYKARDAFKGAGRMKIQIIMYYMPAKKLLTNHLHIFYIFTNMYRILFDFIWSYH